MGENTHLSGTQGRGRKTVIFPGTMCCFGVKPAYNYSSIHYLLCNFKFEEIFTETLKKIQIIKPLTVINSQPLRLDMYGILNISQEDAQAFQELAVELLTQRTVCSRP